MITGIEAAEQNSAAAGAAAAEHVVIDTAKPLKEDKPPQKERAAGILMPVSCLPSPYGIGCFSKEAYDWIDFLKETGQSLWQILPLGPIGFGDSPYQPFSTFAGNPYYISLEELIDKGWLTKEECEQADQGDDPESVDYGKLYVNRNALLKLAYSRSGIDGDPKFLEFARTESFWLEDYAFFMACKDAHEGRCWLEWEDDLRLRKPEALTAAKEELSDEIRYYEFLQYLFFDQWHAVKDYAAENGVKIIGDLPIYVSMDSADVWTRPDLFQLDEEMLPIAVAGCPPDAFSEDGQLWGNPLYDWPAHKKESYWWWLERIGHCGKMYDIIRIDHFRGFDEYYAIPYGEDTARNGKWEPGPGMDLFSRVKSQLPELQIIAEDLGLMTKSVRDLVKNSGFPNMKVLQFAFGGDGYNEHMPHVHDYNMVIYTGTHDNDTLLGYLESISWEEKHRIEDYLNIYNVPDEDLAEGLIRLAFGSVARYCIVPMQDYLHAGSEGRMNRPSSLGENWKWRMQKGAVTDFLIGKLRWMTGVFGRLPAKEQEE